MGIRPLGVRIDRVRGILALAVGLTLVGLTGCAAGRGTYFVVKSVEPVTNAKESGAPESAIFAWTMADQYRRKAWDEWSSSDYQEAERLSKLAEEWAAKAETLAREGGALQLLSEEPTLDEIRQVIKALAGTPTQPSVETPPAVEETSP